MRFYLRVLSYFRKDWALFLILGTLIAVSTGLGLLQAWPMAILVDSVLNPKPRTDWIYKLFLLPLPKSRIGQVIGIAMLGMLMKVTQDVLNLGKTMLNNLINYRGTVRVRHALYARLQALGMGYHKTAPQGDAIFRLTTDSWGFKDVLNVWITAIVSAATLLVMIGIMLSRNVWLTVFAMSVAPVLAWANIYFGRRIKRRQLNMKAADTDFVTAVQRSVASAALVQAYGGERRERARFDTSLVRCVSTWLRLNWEEQLYWLCVFTIFSVGGCIVFGYGGYLVWRDQFAHPVASGGVTCGDVMVFMAYLGGLWDPLQKLTGFTAAIQGGVAGAERVFDVLDHPATLPTATAPHPLPVRRRTLTLDRVGFEYDAEHPVLKSVSAVIRPGKVVAFVGPSGAGKSTLLNLLPRFFDVTAGAIRLDGIDVRDVSPEDLRRNISIVMQDHLVLPTTIRENIAYARPEATMTEIRDAAELAGADFIDKLPEGYDTVVSEGGQNLSGGQRQRIAVARALLGHAPIIVLDEPTSALDPEHEHVVSETLLSLRGRRTVILVSHHLGTVVHCDEIFVMNAGRVIDHGTHRELLAREGLYATLWNLQTAAALANGKTPAKVPEAA